MQNENLIKTLIFVKRYKKMKVGILGGGQLGRMLLQAAANYDVQTYVLEKDNNCPAAFFTFIKRGLSSETSCKYEFQVQDIEIFCNDLK